MQQNTALREVEELLTRLEDAEMLYPSSQVMGSYHPIYKSEEFVGRVKAMCLWYNITKYQRMKLTLIGMLFRRLILCCVNKVQNITVFICYFQTAWQIVSMASARVYIRPELWFGFVFDSGQRRFWPRFDRLSKIAANHHSKSEIYLRRWRCEHIS